MGKNLRERLICVRSVKIQRIKLNSTHVNMLKLKLKRNTIQQEIKIKKKLFKNKNKNIHKIL